MLYCQPKVLAAVAKLGDRIPQPNKMASSRALGVAMSGLHGRDVCWACVLMLGLSSRLWWSGPVGSQKKLGKTCVHDDPPMVI